MWRRSGLTAIRADHPALWAVIEAARLGHSESMSAYLCWLAIRLLELHRVLRPDGSLFLHIDRRSHAYVKLLLDAVFGPANCRNEIVWLYKTGGVSARWFSRKHDIILFYSKSDAYTFHPQREKSYLTHKYGFSNIDIEHDAGGYYRMVAMRDVWDIAALRGNQPEAVGYPTQKPLALYERIIRAASNEGDVVLDPFCGSGTTAVAAERLGRRWLAMDIWDGAYECLCARLEAAGLDVTIRLQREPDLANVRSYHQATDAFMQGTPSRCRSLAAAAATVVQLVLSLCTTTFSAASLSAIAGV